MATITSYTAAYLDSIFATFITQAGGTMTGNLVFKDGPRISGGSSTATENPVIEVLHENVVIGYISNRLGHVTIKGNAGQQVSIVTQDDNGLTVDAAGNVQLNLEPYIGGNSLTDWIENNSLATSGGTIVCTSETRPTTGVQAGQFIWETDTKLLYVYDGAAWKYVPNGVNPYFMAYQSSGTWNMSNNSTEALQFNGVAYNVGGFNFTAPGTTIILPKTGLWHAETVIHAYKTSTAGRLATGVYWMKGSGNVQRMGNSVPVMNAILTGVVSSSIQVMNAGEKVQQLYYQTSGSIWAPSAGTNDITGITLRYLGPA